MTQLFIQLIQSVAGAVLTIIGLLLVASMIGYFSAWFYAKSIYTPIIKGLETDKEQLQKEVAGLRSDIVNLNEQSDKLRDRITGLEKDIEVKAKEIKDLTTMKK
jgi:peptidoglycan hydrolase CwlO-like protein